MAAPEIVETLVARFDRNRELYCGSGYNETQLRREFLDPFFEALGWDVDNKRGVSPLYQDVVHEYGTEVEGSQKTADYAFRVGEKVKFFVEAKKPGTRLKDDAGPALQLRRYAYSAGLPLSILTDFEEFAAYDGRVPPKKADAASRARVMYFTYDRYVEAWEEIAAVFSREAVWSGAFDTYAEKTRGGKAEPVDKAFLKLLEGWRDELARNVANRNREKDLDKYELSAAVQAILDRIIFLRVAEDRGIEDRGRLEALRTGEAVYGRLMDLCLEADDVYNSGLFHFRDEKGRATSRDELTPTLHVDDATLRKIIRELSDSPYEFGVVPVEILGQVYEQFLGKTIWLDGRGVHIDYKPEVRKAKGVYYTPQYIVEYIVKNTVGELLKGCKRPKDAAKLKILDPACGSGSFLLGAYQHLVNWHLEWYVKDGPAKHEGKVVATPGPGPVSWRLTAAAKKDILVNNLFGVDIDPQACEVTKLSLLLKALEGESRESVGAQTKFLRERILPDLGDNVKCGNSLIGSDYFEGGQTSMSVPQDEEERRRVNPFDWEVEFPKIMKAGGFDAVIGNPPYVRLQTLRDAGIDKLDYYKKGFSAARSGNYDIYVLFIERGLGLLVKKGLLGFIVPHKFFNAQYGEPIRTLIAEGRNLFKTVHFGVQQVFEGATTYTCIIVLKKTPTNTPRYIRVLNIQDWLKGKIFEDFEIPAESITGNEWNFVSEDKRRIIEKIGSSGVPLNEITRKIFVGLQTSADKVYVLEFIAERDGTLIAYSEALGEEVELEKGILKPFLMGRDVRRYRDLEARKYVIFPYSIEGAKAELMPKDFISDMFPLAWAYIEKNKKYLEDREKGKMKGENFYAYIYPKNLSEFEQEKIVTPYMANKPDMSYDGGGFLYHTTKVYSVIFKVDVKENPLFFLGILNSKLLWFFIKANSTTFRGDYLVFATEFLGDFPVVKIDCSNPTDVARHDKMVALVEEMLELHKRLAAAKAPADKKRIQRAIAATDRKIDALVYELYGLTDEERRIVEGAK